MLISGITYIFFLTKLFITSILSLTLNYVILFMVNAFFFFLKPERFYEFILTHLYLGKGNALMKQRFQNMEENNSYQKIALRFCHKPFNSKWKTPIKAKSLLWGTLKNNFFPNCVHHRKTARRVPKSWTKNSEMSFLQEMSSCKAVKGWGGQRLGERGRGAGSGKRMRDGCRRKSGEAC